jgi:AcrR family transcriptional regulator
MARHSRKTHLMDVAERLYAERGIRSVSLREINAEANCSPAGLYYHFKSKEILCVAIIKRILYQLVDEHQRIFIGSTVNSNSIDLFFTSLIKALYLISVRDEQSATRVVFLSKFYLEFHEGSFDMMSKFSSKIYSRTLMKGEGNDDLDFKVYFHFMMLLVAEVFSKLDHLCIDLSQDRTDTVKEEYIIEKLCEYVAGEAYRVTSCRLDADVSQEVYAEISSVVRNYQWEDFTF